MKYNWHLECKISGIGHFFQGTMDEAFAKAKELVANDADFSKIVIWGGPQNTERVGEVCLSSVWVSAAAQEKYRG